MIRINLLAVRPKSPERLDALLSPGGSSTFISGREAILGGVFLLVTVVILGVLAYRFASTDEDPGEETAVAEASADPAAEAQAAAVPAEEPEPAAPEPLAPSQPEPAATPAPAQPQAAAQQAPPPRQPRSSPPLAAATGSAGATGRSLTAIRVTPLQDRVDIFLEMTDATRVDGFNVNNPPRVVFDIPGALLLVPDSLRNQAVDSPLVSRLRIAQNKFDPPLVRLVLDAPQFPAIQTSASAAGLSIRVTPGP